MTTLKTLTPPPEVQASAKKGLELAQKTGLVSSSHIRQIGQALANGEPHTRERLRHIGSFLRVHSQDGTVRGWGSEEAPSPAWIAWLLHGGEAGRAWANEHVGKIDMSGPPEGYRYRDFLDEVPASVAKPAQQPASNSSPQVEADKEYAFLLSRSDPRILTARGGVVPPSPFAPKEPPTPGSEAEYAALLDQLDPRINMQKRR